MSDGYRENPTLADLRHFLGAFGRVREGNPHAEYMPLTAEEWVAQKGVPMLSRQRLQRKLVRPKSQECYWNAWRLRKQRARSDCLTYCEGFVLLRHMPIAVMHGWCIDEHGAVLDPSVEQERPAIYMGVAFFDEFAERTWRQLLAQQAIGIMGNLWKFKKDYHWLEQGIDLERMQALRSASGAEEQAA